MASNGPDVNRHDRPRRSRSASILADLSRNVVRQEPPPPTISSSPLNPLPELLDHPVPHIIRKAARGLPHLPRIWWMGARQAALLLGGVVLSPTAHTSGQAPRAIFADHALTARRIPGPDWPRRPRGSATDSVTCTRSRRSNDRSHTRNIRYSTLGVSTIFFRGSGLVLRLRDSDLKCLGACESVISPGVTG